MLLLTSVDFDGQKIKSYAAVVFSPEKKVGVVLLWYGNKR